PNRLRHEMNREAFLDQARAYQDAGLMESIGKVLLFILLSSSYSYTHPMPIHRAQQLERWVQAGEYEKVMRQFGDASAA
ncbi:hypothetical protein ABTN32_20095, partial [Acinetobacter baumannii]